MIKFLPLNLMTDTAASVMFLSRLPMGRFSKDEFPNFAQTAHTFPLAGIIISIPATCILAASLFLGLSPLLSASLAVIALVIITGGLHEDGLADVSDGFWGGQSVEKKLAIMRDSNIGTYGTLALIFGIGLRILCLANILNETTDLVACATFIALCGLSRTCMLFPWAYLPNARPATDSSAADDNAKPAASLSSRYGEPNRETIATTLILSMPLILFLYFSVGSFIAVLSSLLFAIGLTATISWLAIKHIKGHTGDVLGATQQLSEIGLYLGLLIAI